MVDIVDCGNVEEHEGHEWIFNKEVECLGRTVCGAWSHKQHTYIVQTDGYCLGVCNCTFIVSHHGPGAHK